MQPDTVTTTTWIVWALIGFIGGFMVGRTRKPSSAAITLVNVIVGVAFALVGGWLTCKLFGAGDKMQYFSLVVSVLTTSIGLWIVSLFTRRKSVADDDE